LNARTQHSRSSRFLPDKIPRVDADADDWAIVPESYAIGIDRLEDTLAPGGHGTDRYPNDLDVKEKWDGSRD
jgi:hypothetical protein